MAVEARMYVAEINRKAYDKNASAVVLHAATRGEANKSWAAATPTASFSLTISNESAAKVLVEAFEAGQDVRVLLEPIVEE